MKTTTKEHLATENIGSLKTFVCEGWNGEELDFYVGDFVYAIFRKSNLENPLDHSNEEVLKFPVKIYDAINQEPYDDSFEVNKEDIDEASDESAVAEVLLEALNEQHGYIWDDIFTSLGV